MTIPLLSFIVIIVPLRLPSLLPPTTSAHSIASIIIIIMMIMVSHFVINSMIVTVIISFIHIQQSLLSSPEVQAQKWYREHGIWLEHTAERLNRVDDKTYSVALHCIRGDATNASVVQQYKAV